MCPVGRLRPSLLLIVVLLGLFAGAMPGGAVSPAPLAPAVDRSAEPGLLAPIGQALATFQREANRTIATQMRAIRDGATTAPLLVGLLLAFAYGAIHAAGPGHGKLVVMSYFVAREARIGRGLLMGAQIAVMHVLSAIVVVVFADLLLRKGFGGAPSEIPAVRVASYGLILLIGLAMLVRAMSRARSGPQLHRHAAPASCGCEARHDESGLLSLGVGLVPCTGSVLILLYAMANGILSAGVLLVGMIALGMALTMGLLGLVSVMARRLVAGRLVAANGRASIMLDVAGGIAIAALGGALLAGSLSG
jgi:nickel/cobalt exporter